MDLFAFKGGVETRNTGNTPGFFLKRSLIYLFCNLCYK